MISTLIDRLPLFGNKTGRGKKDSNGDDLGQGYSLSTMTSATSRRDRKGDVVRRRARQAVIENGTMASIHDSYPGMVNLSGTLCYMNSVLQVSRWHVYSILADSIREG